MKRILIWRNHTITAVYSQYKQISAKHFRIIHNKQKIIRITEDIQSKFIIGSMIYLIFRVKSSLYRWKIRLNRRLNIVLKLLQIPTNNVIGSTAIRIHFENPLFFFINSQVIGPIPTPIMLNSAKTISTMRSIVLQIDTTITQAAIEARA